ncbi:MAG TPA: alanine--tRNA ligase [Gemmataceae bacterium]|nr:alanine--tRNA ligase [Gemmataceae bacterium]
MLTANEIRQQFIDFFCKKHGHTFVPSSSVVPLDDPTLLFANAGMNQFKPYFLGTEKPPYPRAANTQKCIRAGGKHNDLDDVGKDTYHHTFFEMLGNWSFGDYFKKEAIAWAWELLTEVWKLDKRRLHVTVFEGDEGAKIPRDEEAAGFWRAVGVPDAHIHLGNKKDNFWEMGDTGPCGPCTEIHYDNTPDLSGGKLVNKGTPDVIEIWNLVFIQFNRNPDKSLTPLPAKHVDTGMGFERVTKVLQGKSSNYDTDIFTPILDAFAKMTGKTYGGKLDDPIDIGFRVVADHLRMATFAITDGARPGNKKRDAVVRSVIRRAVRYGYQYFDLREPFLYKLVPVLVEQMGQAFPELKSAPDKVAQIVRDEEVDFYKTIQRGLNHFQAAAASAGSVIPGDAAANLQTTYGFPIDLTRQMAAELGKSIDQVGYAIAITQHKEVSGKGRERHVISAVQGDLPATDDSCKYTAFSTPPPDAVIIGWIQGDKVVRSGRIDSKERIALLLDKTIFYAEQGGQVGDTGEIADDDSVFAVEDTQRLGNSVLHIGRFTEPDAYFEVGQSVTLWPHDRLDIMRNHTATHILNWALRKVLGEHVEQKGSFLDAERTRFDFAHDKPISTEELAEIERLVNLEIVADKHVGAGVMPLEKAKQIPGVRAVFGEKYPDPVRFVSIGNGLNESSIEFCGGTHLSRTSQACLFKIVGQEGVAKGVRRIIAVTGPKAVEYDRQLASVVGELTERFHCRPEELPKRVESLQDEIKKLQQQLKKGASSDLAGTFDKLLASASKAGDVSVLIGEIPAGPDDAIRTQVDRVKQKVGACVVVVGWADGDKVGLLAAVSDDVVKKGVKAGDLIKQIAPIVGGGGGGRPNMAQAGGKDPSKLGEALERARNLVGDYLKT